MSLAIVGGVAGALVAIAAAASLWRASSRLDASVRNAYRWLAGAALLWGAGFVGQEAMATSGTGTSLSFADLLSLLALPALGAGLVGLARVRGEPGTDGRRAQARGALARLADACLLSTALFVIGWLTVFGAEYRRTGESAGVFALQAIHPIADLIALGALLAVAVRARRAGLAPYLALLVIAVGESLAVGARISGLRPGPWSQVIQLIGFCLLGLAPLVAAGRPRPARMPRGPEWPDGLGAATLLAASAAAVAAAIAIGWALNGGSAVEPAVVICGGVAALALVARIADLLRRERAVAATSRASERRFRELADRTSDVVLICNRDGIIRYASPAVDEYGYSPGEIEGRSLSELVHPEDRVAGVRTIRAASGGGPQPGRFPCRVRSADGTWRHVESTVSRYRDAEGADQLLITARDVSDQVALRRQLTYLTFHDGLTGLPNRAYVEDRAKDAADRAAEPGQPETQAGAIFIDLDGFTGVNDSVGHGAGDLLLAQAARRLRAAVPPQDTVARWGGDEFAVLVESAASAPEIVDIAERLAGVITAEPFHVASREISLTASIGVALAGGGGAPGHLLRNADVAMSRAKESGGGRVEVFAAHMHADVMRRLEMASDLRAAITAGKLELDYQPVVEFTTSQVIGVEALVRWTRDSEPVPRGEFLGVAEDSGLIVPLGEQVLREACAQVAAWRKAGWTIGVSVNFSLRQVTAAGFAASVLTALEDSGLPPGALTLEVAERVLIEGAGPMVDGLAELRRHGVRLAIDDFGTGYASLAYLRQLAVDVIKIDPSFVAGLGEDATLAMLTRTIIQVGHDLGIEVVAEGIERPEHLELLRGMGCGLGQGYLIARPMSARGIEALVGSGWPGGEAAGGQPGGDDDDDGAALAAAVEGGEAGQPEFAPDPGPVSDPGLDPGEAPAPAAAPAK
jgi:diguanylate cyclase (GGDEF)-like protein/PAS domain S-box-containing protein